MKCDATKEEDVKNVIQWTRKNLGGADVLVNNAGLNRYGKLTGIEFSLILRFLYSLWSLVSQCCNKYTRNNTCSERQVLYIMSRIKLYCQLHSSAPRVAYLQVNFINNIALYTLCIEEKTLIVDQI